MHMHVEMQGQPNPRGEAMVAELKGVSTLLDRVEAAVQELGEGTARDRLIAALGALSTDLLAHLAFEEEHIAGTLRTFTRWPGW
jgi:hypothetical protein